jgi:hypothetical protein
LQPLRRLTIEPDRIELRRSEVAWFSVSSQTVGVLLTRRQNVPAPVADGVAVRSVTALACE